MMLYPVIKQPHWALNPKAFSDSWIVPINIKLSISYFWWKFFNLLQKKEKTRSICTNTELIVSASYDGAY